MSALLGAVVLFFGRRLFWLCVAAIGFAVGVELAPQLVHENSPWLSLTLALVLGFAGALLALFLQKLAIALAGFVAGGRLALALVATFFVHQTLSAWIVFIIGGVIGALLLLFLFDWALILISALIGAHLITSAMTLPSTGKVLLFTALVLIGVIAQAFSRRRAQPVAA
ncbi:MAG: TMEM198/TM7SF3 family protein [Verrucomicrobiota bacterium]|nr:TMEM198/TM7SF3 family protein [Verrucomicrobiota bacterium]